MNRSIHSLRESCAEAIKTLVHCCRRGLGVIVLTLGSLTWQQAFAEQRWVPMEQTQVADALLPVQRAAVNVSAESDRLFLYMGNRNETWLRFIPSTDAPIDSEPSAILIQVDEGRPRILHREGKVLGLMKFISIHFYPVPGGLEWSLGTSSPTSERSLLLKEMAQGRVLSLIYFSKGKRRRVHFTLDNNDVVYQVLGLREAVASGVVQNIEDYEKFSSDVSLACSIRVPQTKLDYSECMKPFNTCKTAHPKEFHQLAACAQAAGVQTFPASTQR